MIETNSREMTRSEIISLITERQLACEDWLSECSLKLEVEPDDELWLAAWERAYERARVYRLILSDIEQREGVDR